MQPPWALLIVGNMVSRKRWKFKRVVDEKIGNESYFLRADMAALGLRLLVLWYSP